MNYKFLLFDMDDTLFDFQQTEKAAFRQVIIQNDIPYSEEVVAAYKGINHELWTDYELGKIKKEEIFVRFDRLMAVLHLPVNGQELERQYRLLLGKGIDLMPDAKAVCHSLAEQYEMYIVTNGTAKTQHERLEASGLKKYFKNVFTSEYIGAAKPSEVFFDYVKAYIPAFEADKALIIGDSLICDIGGGKKAGIDTCWMNRNSLDHSPKEAVYTVGKLSELFEIV